MSRGGNMHILAGWTEVDCKEADGIRGAQPVTPGSSLTDMDGEFGEPVIYTEWWDEQEHPVLRDYLWHPHREDRWCTHFVPQVSS